MKHIFFYLLVLFTSQLALAQHHHHHHHDPPSVHGMVLFGEKHTYLSHLPMFHNPHDYQTILKVELEPELLEAYLKNKNGEELFTIVPEVFVLPEMVAKPVPFQATLVKGHFERGGTPILKGQVKISKVLYHQKLVPNGFAPIDYTGIMIGDEDESYLLHKISKKPDFDQISKVSLPFGDFQVYQAIKKEGFVVVPLVDHKNDLAIEAGVQHQTFPPFPRRAWTPMDIEAVIYTEFGDLSF